LRVAKEDDVMAVDSELAQMLETMNGPPLRDVPLEILRSDSPIPTLPSAALFKVEERRIASDNHDIGVRVYHPRSAEVMPALVYFHGGGFVLGDLNSHDSSLRQLALEADCIVASIDYRLAPEHRFPAAIKDAVTSVRWVHAHAAELGIDSERIVVGGDSAGGTLAAVTALQLRDDGEKRLCGQLLIYPVTRLRGPIQGSLHAFREGYFLKTDDMSWFEDCYLGDTQDENDWRASPLLAPDMTSLPPSWVITAEFDPLLDQGAAYAGRLSAAGNDCTYTCYPGAIHGFFGMPAAIGRQAIADAATWLKKVALRDG
jgi:acetyl esterase